MNKISITKIIFFFLLVEIEHINASPNNLRRKRKTTATTTSFIDAISNIFINDNWNCCDGTNEPTVTPSSSPIISVTNTPTTSQPTSYASSNPSTSTSPSISTSPTYDEKKLTASDGTNQDEFGSSCSMSGDFVVIGAPAPYDTSDTAAYLYHLNGNEVSKITPGDDVQDDDYWASSISMDEKVVIGTGESNYVQIFSLEGDYERSITCDDCPIFGQSVETYGERIVISGGEESAWNLFIYTTEGQLLKTIDNGDDYMYDVDISDEVVVFTTELKTYVYFNTAPDFEMIVEIPQGGAQQ